MGGCVRDAMRKVKIGPKLDAIIAIHETRSRIHSCALPLFDYYLGERWGLHLHKTYSGAVYYSDTSRALIPKHMDEEVIVEAPVEEVAAEEEAAA